MVLSSYGMKILRQNTRRDILHFFIPLLVFLFAIQSQIALAEPQSGQIIRDPDHPQWLMRKGGSHLFIVGPGDPEEFLYLGFRFVDGTRWWGGQTDLVNRLITHGGNCIYMQVVRSHGGDGESDHNPFVDSDPGKGLDFDILDQWERWFTLMDDHNILIYLFIYDDSSRIWDTGDDVGPEERAFIEGIVNRFEHHKNLIWVVGEEVEEAYTKLRVQNIAQVIRDTDDFDHLVGAHQLNSKTFTYFAAGGALDHFSMNQSTGTLDAVHEDALIARRLAESSGDGNGYMVIWSENVLRKSNVEWLGFNWAAAMGGLQVMNLGNHIWDASDTDLKQCRILQEFFERTDFYAMAQRNDLAFEGTDYVLANETLNSFIAYASNLSGDIGVRNMSAGLYELRWVDAVTGRKVIQSGIDVSDGAHRFSKPPALGNHIAVWLHTPARNRIR